MGLSDFFGIGIGSGIGMSSNNVNISQHQQYLNAHAQMQQNVYNAQQQAYMNAPQGQGYGWWQSGPRAAQNMEMTETIIKFVLYEIGMSKGEHDEFIGKNFTWILGRAQELDNTGFLAEMRAAIPKLKFKKDMSSILDDEE